MCVSNVTPKQTAHKTEHLRLHTCELGDEVDGLCHHEGHLLYQGLHAIGEVLQSQKATHGSSHLVCQLRLRDIEQSANNHMA